MQRYLRDLIGTDYEYEGVKFRVTQRLHCSNDFTTGSRHGLPKKFIVLVLLYSNLVILFPWAENFEQVSQK